MLDLWYRALASDHGIQIICSDPVAVRKALYDLRAKVQDLDLMSISINLSPFDRDRLWLVKETDGAT
jgi:hypothetical protein